MPEELKNIKENVMNQINQGKLKMKPKTYFIIGSILTFFGVVFSITTSTFLIGLIRFSLRAHGPMSAYRLDQMIANFPLWTLVLAIITLSVGIWSIRQYDFSYKKEPWMIIMIFILAIIVAGWIVDIIGVNDQLMRRGPMKGMMNNYFEKGDFRGVPGSGPGWRR